MTTAATSPVEAQVEAGPGGAAHATFGPGERSPHWFAIDGSLGAARVRVLLDEVRAALR